MSRMIINHWCGRFLAYCQIETKKIPRPLRLGDFCGDSWTRTNGRASLGRLTQAPLALAPHDVNDVLSLIGVFAPKTTRYSTFST